MNRALTICLLIAVLVSGCSHGEKGAASTPEGLLNSALVELTAGRYDTAERLLKQLVAEDPGNVVAHYNLGVIYQGRGDLQTALTEYGSALTSNPTYVPALFNTAVIYAGTDPGLAITTYRRVIALQPKAPTAYLNLGLLEIGNHLRSQGLRDLSTALHQDPTLISRLSPDLKQSVGKLNQSPQPSPSLTS